MYTCSSMTDEAEDYPPIVADGDFRHFNEPILAPTGAVKQHYVPQTYLARFASDGRIAVYDFQEGKHFETSLKNAAVERRFYDLRSGQQTQSTEDWLGEAEGAAAPILTRLVADPDTLLALTDEEENHVARYVAAQRFRVPAFRGWHRAVRQHLIDQMKPMARAYLENTLPPAQVEEVWREWEKKPDEWWLSEDAPIQDAETTTYMLSEVQGWANLLEAMAWRVGLAHPSARLYTSDNPVSSYLPPVRPWWSGGALWEHLYVFPLSPHVLMRIDPMGYETEVEPKGPRERMDFSPWETSFARHVVTNDATRFIYGTTSPVPRDCASSCLKRINAAKAYDAAVLQGWRPTPPRLPSALKESPDSETVNARPRRSRRQAEARGRARSRRGTPGRGAAR